MSTTFVQAGATYRNGYGTVITITDVITHVNQNIAIAVGRSDDPAQLRGRLYFFMDGERVGSTNTRANLVSRLSDGDVADVRAMRGDAMTPPPAYENDPDAF